MKLKIGKLYRVLKWRAQMPARPQTITLVHPTSKDPSLVLHIGDVVMYLGEDIYGKSDHGAHRENLYVLTKGGVVGRYAKRSMLGEHHEIYFEEVFAK